MLRIFVIDGDATRRAQVCRLLMDRHIHSEPFETTEEFIELMPSHGLVLYCDDGQDVDCLVEAIEQRSWLPVIAYAEQIEISRVVSAMQAGAASYVAYPIDVDMIVAEYSKLEGGLADRFARRDRERVARRQLELLSNREREILGCMLDHGTSKEIARTLGISPRTVEAHRANLMARLDVRTASQAIRIAVEADAFRTSTIGADQAGATALAADSLALAPILQ